MSVGVILLCLLVDDHLSILQHLLFFHVLLLEPFDLGILLMDRRLVGFAFPGQLVINCLGVQRSIFLQLFLHLLDLEMLSTALVTNLDDLLSQHLVFSLACRPRYI